MVLRINHLDLSLALRTPDPGPFFGPADVGLRTLDLSLMVLRKFFAPNYGLKELSIRLRTDLNSKDSTQTPGDTFF